MSLFDSPDPPDPTATAQAQAGYNRDAAITQARLNMVNQNNPFGSLSYTQSGQSADGTPTFTANTTLSPQIQALYDKQLSNAQNGLDWQTTQNKQNELFSNLYDPVFQKQSAGLDAKLAAQGITQGSDAYNNAVKSLQGNQNDARTSFYLQSQPTAFNESLAEYSLPSTTLAGLRGNSSPSYISTPSEQIQPANYSGLVEQNYQQQVQQQNNMLNGLFGLGGAGIKAATMFL